MIPIKKQVPAFTMLELIIVSLLSAIVIGITYTAYFIMAQGYLKFNKKNEDMGVLLRVDELLRKDFERSEAIYFNGHQYVFKDSLQVITYDITPNFLVRNSQITDTFKVKSANIDAFFEKKIIIKNETNSDSTQLLNDLSLSLLYQSDTINYHYHKTYSSQNLIKANANAVY